MLSGQASQSVNIQEGYIHQNAQIRDSKNKISLYNNKGTIDYNQ